ncbi:MAG: SRPBCC family protein [Acidobacteriota bacterium]
MKAAAAALLGSVACLGAMAAERDFGPWETVADGNGIKVEARKAKATGVVETRASVMLGCKPDELWKAITTSESYVKLMPNTKESRHIEEHPEPDGRSGFLYVYQRLDGSPSSDRDYTLEVRWSMTDTDAGHGYTRSWSVKNDKGPGPVDGVVRVAVNEGHWTLTPAANGGTSFVYEDYCELGGSLWTRLANGASKDSARGFVENLLAAFPAGSRDRTVGKPDNGGR